MGKALRVLMVESPDVDAEQVLCALRRAGYDVHHVLVETAEAMRAALAEASWDVALSDSALPTFSGARANQEKGRIERMSHELQAPLNAMIGFSERLEQVAGSRLTADERSYLDYVLLSGRHLLALIGDSLDLSKIEAGRALLACQPVALRAIVGEVAELLEPLMMERGVALRVSLPDGELMVSADPVRLRQILSNLLSNGLKLTPRGGSVELEAHVEDGRVLSLAVRDTGVGIRAEDLPRLFKPFERLAPAVDQGIEGTGLGLALTKQLVEQHGGTISVASEPGKGSTFTLRLPLLNRAQASTDTTDASPSKLPPSSAPGPRAVILVVEDDIPSLRLNAAVLMSRGHEILEARSADEALAVLELRTPDVILTDLQLPGGGGERVLKEVRMRPALAHLAVVATTAHAMQGDRERVLAAGFDGYLSKPINIREIGAIVESFVKLSAAARRETA